MKVIHSNHFKIIFSKIIFIFIFLTFLFSLFLNAWISDDAYITFRSVYNFTHGYGLTWNIDERVQVYTNTLYFLLMSFLSFFTGEVYFTSIFLNFILSFLSILLITIHLSKNTHKSMFLIVLCFFSKAFVDYSSSGLENALAHFLFVLFFIYFFRLDFDKFNFKNLFFITIFTSFILLNRLDHVLFLLPILFYSLFLCIKNKFSFWLTIKFIFIGALPFLIWEFFSLIYYGFFVPNTAFAKLNTGIDYSEYIKQGFHYFSFTFKHDPITLPLILLGVIASFLSKNIKLMLMSFGIFLYLLYVIKIGGDFMMGRFFSTPFILSLMLISQIKLVDVFSKNFLVHYIVLFLCFGIGFSIPNHSLNFQTPIDFSSIENENGITDEKALYFAGTGFIHSKSNLIFPKFRWYLAGLEYRESHLHKPIIIGSVGMFGYASGPTAHIIDYLALSDPLLSHLPAIDNPKWRIGHFARHIPEGYLETITTGNNSFKDRDLSVYYQHLSLITKGDLFTKKRFITILNMNLGKYDHLIDKDRYRFQSGINYDLEDPITIPSKQWLLKKFPNTNLNQLTPFRE